jgi:hypothetical protein
MWEGNYRPPDKQKDRAFNARFSSESRFLSTFPKKKNLATLCSHRKLARTQNCLTQKNVSHTKTSPSKSASHTNLSPTPICTLHKSVPHTNLSAHKSVSHTNLSPSQIYLLHKSVSPSKTSPSHNSYLLAKRGVL